jgi:hypothetical protein
MCQGETARESAGRASRRCAVSGCGCVTSAKLGAAGGGSARCREHRRRGRPANARASDANVRSGAVLRNARASLTRSTGGYDSTRPSDTTRVPRMSHGARTKHARTIHFVASALGRDGRCDGSVRRAQPRRLSGCRPCETGRK